MTGLTNLAHDPILDLDPWVGQRSVSYRFERINSATLGTLGALTPTRDATMSHNAASTISRTVSMNLGVSDTENINPLTERVDIYMTFPGVEYPLGRFVYTDESKQLWTSGSLGSMSLVDQMFVVDQPLTQGYNAYGKSSMAAIQDVMSAYPSFRLSMEASSYQSAESWGIGASRGSVLQSLALSGDYFSPWFGNDGNLHFIRSFDPATRIPDFDWDSNRVVMRAGITDTSDILTAPNRFIVISNNAANSRSAVVGTAEVPISAPHSIANRGFAITQVSNLQLYDATQAQAVAENLAQRQTVFERVQMSTAPDPRHDSYNVIRWQGSLWLEIAWSLQLSAGGKMTHTLRKSYTS